MKTGAKVVIAGDFNIEMAKLDEPITVTFQNLLRSLNLVCTNKLPTRNKSCIDNIIVNFPDNYYNISLLPGCLADHEPLLFKYYAPNFESKSQEKYIQSFRKQTDENISMFYQILLTKNWDSLY